MFNKFDKAEKDIYQAQNGDIKSGWIIIPKRAVKYDTRAFEKIIYGETPRRYRAQEEELRAFDRTGDDKLKWLMPVQPVRAILP